MKKGDRDTSRGREGPREPSNVVKLPRDWLGPRSELVPFGPSADRQPGKADEPASADDAAVLELVPPASLTQDDFWGGTLDAIPHPVVGPKPAESARQEPRADAVPSSGVAPLTQVPTGGSVPAPSADAPGMPVRDGLRAANRPDPAGRARIPRITAVVRPAVRPLRERRAAAMAAAVAALLIAGVGDALLSGSAPAPIPATVAVGTPPFTGPVLSLNTDRAKPWRLPVAHGSGTSRHGSRHVSKSRRPSTRSVGTGATPVSVSYPASTSYTANQSRSYQPASTTPRSTSEATTARSTQPGPSGAGAPFGPGTLGS